MIRSSWLGLQNCAARHQAHDTDYDSAPAHQPLDTRQTSTPMHNVSSGRVINRQLLNCCARKMAFAGITRVCVEMSPIGNIWKPAPRSQFLNRRPWEQSEMVHSGPRPAAQN